MNTNTLILAALSGINLPKYPLVAPEEQDAEYITFNDADNRPDIYASGEELTEVAIVQIHYFTKNNPKTVAKQIRKALRHADFVIVDTQEFYENDTKSYHTVVEAQIEQDAEEGD